MVKMVNFVLCVFYHNLIKNKYQCPGVISALAWTKTEGEITKSRGWSRKGGPGRGTKVKVCKGRGLVRAECRPFAGRADGLRNGVKLKSRGGAGRRGGRAL